MKILKGINLQGRESEHPSLKLNDNTYGQKNDRRALIVYLVTHLKFIGFVNPKCMYTCSTMAE